MELSAKIGMPSPGYPATIFFVFWTLKKKIHTEILVANCAQMKNKGKQNKTKQQSSSHFLTGASHAVFQGEMCTE